MFTILYETSSGVRATQSFDSTDRHKLTRHIATFNCRVIEVYEQATPITNTVRRRLEEYPGAKSRHAIAFVNSLR